LVNLLYQVNSCSHVPPLVTSSYLNAAIIMPF
jgi:hypothetical protein